MYLTILSTFGPKHHFLSTLLKTFGRKVVSEVTRYRVNPSIMTSMEKIIDEINTNHIQILTKIRDLEHKIAAKERLTGPTGAARPILTADEIQTEKQRLIRENESLRLEVNQLVDTLSALEAKRDPKSAAIAFKSTPNGVAGDVAKTPATITEDTKASPKSTEDKPKKERPKKEPKATPTPKANADDNKPLDVSRLDLRVGRILSAKRHPDADSLYVEDIDCGEESPRTVVSGLVRFVPLEEMSDRLVVVLCNLKPAKMRGITSEAMVMCASTPDKVEILAPPEGSVPGDRVVFDNYPGSADSQLNPKKKIWEQIAPDLKTNGDCVATYKGEAFKVDGKGLVTAKTLANVVVK